DLETRGLSRTQSQFLADQLSDLVNGKFTPPSQSNLLELSIREGTHRALTQKDTFETQRDFRDKLADELRAVGFERQNALYLANSVAAYGGGGGAPSVYGASLAQVAAMNASLAEQISSGAKMSRESADALVQEARQRVDTKGPFASDAEF